MTEKNDLGIYQPLPQNRFRVDFSDEEGNDYKALTIMITNVTTFYEGNFFNIPCKGKASLNIDVSKEVLVALNKLYNNKFNMEVVTLMSDEEIPKEILTNCTVSNATMHRSYEVDNQLLIVDLDIEAENYEIE